MVAAKLPDIMSGSITFENILRVLEWLVKLSKIFKEVYYATVKYWENYSYIYRYNRE